MKLVLKNLTDTKKLAQRIIKKATTLKNEEAIVVGLVGPLGAGKTTLVQYLAKELGIKQIVNSPTFVLMKEYQIEGRKPKAENRNFKKLIHLDAYRLDSPQALLDIGLLDYLNDSRNFIVIEWADKVKKILPKNTVWLNLSLIKQKRIVEFK